MRFKIIYCILLISESNDLLGLISSFTLYTIQSNQFIFSIMIQTFLLNKHQSLHIFLKIDMKNVQL